MTTCPECGHEFDAVNKEWIKETKGYIPAWLKTCKHTDKALARAFWWYANDLLKRDRMGRNCRGGE